MEKFVCGNCGGKVPVPPGFAKAKIRCGHCGYYADLPPEFRSAEGETEPEPTTPKTKKPPRATRPSDEPPEPKAPVKPLEAKPRPHPRDTRAKFEAEENAGPPLLEGTQDEDDDKPYGVHGTGLKNCPDCQGELPLEALFCVHCGSHLDGTASKRSKPKRSYTEIDETHGEGFPLPTRIGLFAGAQVLNGILMVIGYFASGSKFDAAYVVTAMFTALINTGVQAFILGSFDTLRVQRNTKGKGTLTRMRRLGFFPLAPAKIDWKGSTGVGRLATHAGGIFDWATCIYLLVCAGCIPGIIFWWMVLKPEQYDIVTCNVYSGVEERLFRSKNQEQAEAIAKLVCDATALQYKDVI